MATRLRACRSSESASSHREAREREVWAELAHEAIFRRWDKLRGWISAESEFLAWKTRLEAARRTWQATPDVTKDDAVLMGLALAQAQSWLEKRAGDLPAAMHNFIVRSGEVDSERREVTRQLEYRRVKADEELARLRAEKEAREQRERADAEARAKADEELARLRAEKEAREQRGRADAEARARRRAWQYLAGSW